MCSSTLPGKGSKQVVQNPQAYSISVWTAEKMVEWWREPTNNRDLRWHKRFLELEGHETRRLMAVAAGLILQIELFYNVMDEEG
jgi:hypothetical protein